MSLSVAKDLECKIAAWLDAHGNKIELDINEGLDVPSNWEVYPQTRMSSFNEGVRIETYENGPLRVNVFTRFFAIYGHQEQKTPIMDKPADEGTYLQLRRDIEGIIRLDMPLVFE
ncbi:unnamed protein product [Rotaria sp. Silwood1]|nr:unnamed protein product [Rotaria sp. Silwood1]CAF1648672.1 unnamed protein product [Rotaria sp. Silwood1]CAF3692150.1 unnamed protein product [Rotaria sp. Silwood1]CAF4707149.1 unnamed protein product [Rotaria sp. Silwood1]CAF4852205.1 unnamed protein product [Rotaria sp. Silwood1]